MGREDTVQPTDWSGVPSDSLPNATYVYNVGIYGWRKRCLYGLILFILIIVIINFALTIWILRVMDFSEDGMGKLRIVEKGIRVEGETEFLYPLHASSIISREELPLSLEGTHEVTVNARNGIGQIQSQLTLDDKMLNISTFHLVIQDPEGKVFFSADGDNVHLGPSVLKVSGDGGTVFEKAIQTPNISADSFQHLKLESPTRSINVQAANQIDLKSIGGDIGITCLADLELKSNSGSIRLNSKNVVLKNLKISEPNGVGRSYEEVHQLCACSNGKLFTSPTNGLCQATREVCS